MNVRQLSKRVWLATRRSQQILSFSFRQMYPRRLRGFSTDDGMNLLTKEWRLMLDTVRALIQYIFENQLNRGWVRVLMRCTVDLPACELNWTYFLLYLNFFEQVVTWISIFVLHNICGTISDNILQLEGFWDGHPYFYHVLKLYVLNLWKYEEAESYQRQQTIATPMKRDLPNLYQFMKHIKSLISN